MKPNQIFYYKMNVNDSYNYASNFTLKVNFLTTAGTPLKVEPQKIKLFSGYTNRAHARSSE